MYFLDGNNHIPPLPFWWTVTGAMIGSSVIAAVVTFFATKKLKGTDFSYDYKKHIVEKRKEAYDKVEEVIHQYEAVKPLMGTILISYNAGTTFTMQHLLIYLKRKLLLLRKGNFG